MTTTTSTLQYFDSGSWKDIGFSRWKHKRQLGNVEVLEVVMDKNKQPTLEANMEMRMKMDGTIRFGGFIRNQGQIDKTGELNLKIYGYGKRVLNKRNSMDKSNTDNVAVAKDLANDAQYHNDSGTLTNFTCSSPSVSTFSISNYSSDAKGSHIKQEMEDHYSWELYWQGDGNAYYEPFGYYSSGETIDSSTDATQMVRYEPGKTKDIISEIKVIGTDDSGNKHPATASDSADKGVENFKRIHVGYLSSDPEAQAIADQMLQLNVVDNLVVDVFLYETNLVNETIDVTDSTRGINNETFVVQKQETTWPEERTTLYLVKGTREQSWFAKTHKRELEERRERSSQITNSGSIGVGNQASGTLDTGSDSANVSTSGGVTNNSSNTGILGGIFNNASNTSIYGDIDSDPSNTSMSGSVDVTGVGFDYADGFQYNDGSSISDGEDVELYIDVSNTSNKEGNYLLIEVTAHITKNNSSTHGWDLEIENDDHDKIMVTVTDWIPGSAVGVPATTAGTVINSSLFAIDGSDINSGETDTMKITITNNTTVDEYVELGASCALISRHDHGDNFSTTDQDHDHGDDFGTNDSDHGHGDDFSASNDGHGHSDNIGASGDGHSGHGVTGKTSSKDVNIPKEDKDDR